MLNVFSWRRVKNRRNPRRRNRRKMPVATRVELLESRRLLDSTVVLNEVMYHPSGTDGRQQEWVELHNQLAVDVDLSGWRLSDGVDFEFPEGSRITGRGYLVVASDTLEFQRATGIQAFGPLERRLSNAGELIELRDNSGRLMDQLDYGDEYPWPVASDGSGATLAKLEPMTGSSHPENWASSIQIGGTPGAENFHFSTSDGDLIRSPSESQIRFNEMAAGGKAFWLELVNLEDHPVDLDGYVIAASSVQAGYQLPPSELPSGGMMQIDTTQLGFRPRAGDRLFLYTPERMSVVDGQMVTDRLRGRSAEHDGRWLFPSVGTPGAPNQFTFHDEIVINEIQYHARPELSAPETPAQFGPPTRLVPFGSAWLYNQSGTDLGSDWYQTIYQEDEVAWFTGAAPLGFETAQQADLIRTQFDNPRTRSSRVTTFYFQTQFEFTGDINEPDLYLRLAHLVDDGAAFYLNGVEIERFQLPEGPLEYATFATRRGPDASLVGPVNLPVDQLKTGTNVLSVELHQKTRRSPDMMLDVELSVARRLAPPIPGRSFAESDEEWIELYNRSLQTIDLTGWQLNNAVRFDFPVGTVISPNEYLLVAGNATQFQQQYPGLSSIVGEFSGTLSNSTEMIVLLDQNGNPADEVTYYDNVPWPNQSDGNGATLELRDADVDNSRAEAWAASDDRGKSTWQYVKYRGVGTSLPDTNDPDVWHELVFGLLDAGEILIDDISVVEDPDGAAVELIRDGGFDDGAKSYRLRGNHGAHGLSQVIPDPDDPQNPVLHLVATGPTEHMSNHVETTLAGNRDPQDHLVYEVSYRARWQKGSGQLNTRLYFNQVARTVGLEMPTRTGTPGAPNSTRVTDLGPTYANLAHHPPLPTADEQVTVTVQSADRDGISSMTLWFSADGGPWNTVEMNESKPGHYFGKIPPHPDGTLVQLYVEGMDASGVTSHFPAGGPESRALYRVDNAGDRSPLHHDFHLLLTARDRTLQKEITNVMSNHRVGGTVITDGGMVYYDVGVRLKGSGYGRRVAAHSYNIRFHSDQLFRGVHDVVSVDRLGVTHREVVVKHIGIAAGGVPGMYDDLIFFVPTDGTFAGPAQLQMARYDTEFLDASYDNGSDGTRFKMELIYYSTQSANGESDGTKLPPRAVLQVDIADMGDDKEAYRWNFLIKNHRQRDDYSRIMELGKTLSLTDSENGGELDVRSQQVMDVDQWLRVFAFQSLGGVNDTYHQGGNFHNLQLFVRPDQRFVALPWDQDQSFHLAPKAGVLGGSNFRRVQTIPNNQHAYYGHLHDIISTTYNLEYLAPWIDHYAMFLSNEESEDIKDYVRTRKESVLRRLPEIVDFSVDGDDRIVVHDSIVSLSGRGWIDVAEIRVVGVDEKITIEWIDDVNWRFDLPVSFGSHELTLRAYNLRGEEVGADSVVVESTLDKSPLENYLRVSEVMFNPPRLSIEEYDAGYEDKDDFEYIELVNVGERTIQLAGAGLIEVNVGRVSQGVGFDFASSLVTELGPGERVLVVEDANAFAFRYGDDLPVAGQWSGRLSDTAETITVLAGGRIVQQFTYDHGWYAATDGGGASLEINDVAMSDLENWSQAAGWNASLVFSGTPGIGAPAVTPDMDGNGVVNAADIDGISAAIRFKRTERRFDLNDDGAVDQSDRDFLIRDVARTRLGDANFDRVFDVRDFTLAFEAGEYEDDIDGNSSWAEGDWNGDGDFDSEDIVAAFIAGHFVDA